MKSQLIGNVGELASTKYLLKQGYQIIHKNWRHKRLEVDLICKKDDMLIFVEVKTRSSRRYGQPEVFVDAAKQKHLMNAADAYCYTTDYDSEIRFDIIAIDVNQQQEVEDIKHFPDAFYEIG